VQHLRSRELSGWKTQRKVSQLELELPARQCYGTDQSLDTPCLAIAVDWALDSRDPYAFVEFEHGNQTSARLIVEESIGILEDVAAVDKQCKLVIVCRSFLGVCHSF